MIQKKVKFNGKAQEKHEHVENTSHQGETTSGSKSRRFKEKHSLDSDEELDGEEGGTSKEENILKEEDIEGQEDETIRDDEGIQVTPFNLKDELEEGHFDVQGNYIANKDDATDQWLESADWNKAENQFQPKRKPPAQDQIEEAPVRSPFQLMQEMIVIMSPGENVLKCLRRLGGNKKPISTADRWKKKKQKVAEEVVVDPKAEEDKANLLKLTGLADELLQQGDFQVYEKTYEKLKFEIDNKLSQFQDADSSEEGEPSIPRKKQRMNQDSDVNSNNDNSELICEDDDDELEAAFNKMEEKQPTRKPPTGKEKVVGNRFPKIDTNESSSVSLTDEVCWIYKWSESDTEHLGPFTSTDMMKKQEEGIFGNGVFCRKVGSDGSFYSSKRIDFELYT